MHGNSDLFRISVSQGCAAIFSGSQAAENDGKTKITFLFFRPLNNSG